MMEQFEKQHITDESVIVVKCAFCHRIEFCALPHEKHICGYCGQSYPQQTGINEFHRSSF